MYGKFILSAHKLYSSTHIHTQTRKHTHLYTHTFTQNRFALAHRSREESRRISKNKNKREDGSICQLKSKWKNSNSKYTKSCTYTTTLCHHFFGLQWKFSIYELFNGGNTEKYIIIIQWSYKYYRFVSHFYFFLF